MLKSNESNKYLPLLVNACIEAFVEYWKINIIILVKIINKLINSI